MRLVGNPNPDGYYEPNSFNGPLQDERFRESPRKISGDADRHDHRDGNDDYRQAGDLFRLMSPAQKEQLFQNYKAAMERAGADRQAADPRTGPRPLPNTAPALPGRWA
jgi:catalase